MRNKLTYFLNICGTIEKTVFVLFVLSQVLFIIVVFIHFVSFISVSQLSVSHLSVSNIYCMLLIMVV